MTVSQDKDLAAYLKEARSFDYDSRLAAERSKRTAWIIAGAASVMALTTPWAAPPSTRISTRPSRRAFRTSG